MAMVMVATTLMAAGDCASFATASRPQHREPCEALTGHPCCVSESERERERVRAVRASKPGDDGDGG